MATFKFPIVHGPSLGGLRHSLTSTCYHCRVVAFRVQGTYEYAYSVSVVIDGLSREDDSGENWTIRGQIFNDLTGLIRGSRYFHGTFSTKTRTGCLEPDEE